MPLYYVNDRQQDNGDHEVHKEDCVWLPMITSKTYLGVFPSCHGAVQAAKRIYPTADGCKTCSKECHNS